jgi:hypothetical protein
VGCIVSSTSVVNLRTGAGTDFDIAGQLESEESRLVSGKFEAEDGYLWWHLRDGAWVRSDVLQAGGACDKVPFVDSE